MRNPNRGRNLVLSVIGLDEYRNQPLKVERNQRSKQSRETNTMLARMALRAGYGPLRLSFFEIMYITRTSPGLSDRQSFELD